MKSKQILFRQGDVLLELVAAIPAGAKDVTPTDRIVLAYGEVTGHAHAVYPEIEMKARASAKVKPTMPARMWDAGAERFLQVLTPTALKHEDHAPVALDPGIYRVKRQREYSPETIRTVAD